MYRSHTCGELRINNAGNTVTLAGWVQTIRKFGASLLLTFVTAMALLNYYLVKN